MEYLIMEGFKMIYYTKLCVCVWMGFKWLIIKLGSKRGKMKRGEVRRERDNHEIQIIMEISDN